MTSYCTVEDVTQLASVRKEFFFQNSENDEEDFNNMIQKWILLASRTIDKYCNRKFSDSIPEDIRLATALMVSNILAFSQSRKETPIIKKDDWTVDFLDVKLFTDDIKEILDSYVVSKVNSNNLTVYCVSGDNHGES